jgi:hypothetical protein
MNLTETLKQEIDKMDYTELLRKWRFSPLGDPMFKGESGDYFCIRMKKLKINDEHHAKVSKEIGW